MRKNVRVITCLETKRRLAKTFLQNISMDEMNELVGGIYSRNSLLAMRKDWNLFVDFCLSKNVNPLPAATTAVRMFLEKESQRRKYATIKRYAVTLGLIHKILGFSDPTSSVAVSNLLSQLRIEKKSDARSTTAFNKQHLETLTNILFPSKHPRDIRNLAIYHFMFECMLKRSELRDFPFEDITNCTDSTLTVWLGNEQYQLTNQAFVMIRRWIQVRGEYPGPLFTAIDKHGNLNKEPLNDSSIYRILRAASDTLKLDIKFSGQSLRVGAAAEMAANGVKVKDIQRFGRWKSAAMPYQYIGNSSQAALEMMVFKSFKPWD